MTQMKAVNDLLLSNVSSAYIPTGLIASQILPNIPSAQTSGKLAGYGSGHLRIESTLVGGRGQYRRVDTITKTSDQYLVEGHGLEGFVSENDYRNSQDPFSAESDEVMGVTSLLALAKEKSLADVLSDTAILTQNDTLIGNDQLSDYQNSDAIAVFETAVAAVKAGCGTIDNMGAIMSWEVYRKLRSHPQLLDQLGYKYNRPGGLTGQEMADILGVSRVLIGNASYNSAKEGQAAVLSPVWGKNLILAIIPPSAQKYQVSLGYNITLSGMPERRVTKWAVNNPPNSTSILVDDWYDMFLSNVKAAYLIKNVIA